ncbi:MAG TPA: hypothetical protein PLS94_00250 [Prolixibacteraceae bacterium]|nr:hypothetical protein [Prolixibacteraceae bacterium]
MNTLAKYSIFFSLLFAGFTVFAQSESSLDKEVEVIKAYQPNVLDAQKITSNPSINDTANYSPEFDYRIFSKDIEVEKTINHLPMVKLGTPPRIKPNKGYAKAGFGNALSPYAEVLINTSPSRNVDFGLQLFHYSSRPTIMLNNGIKVKTPFNNNMAKIFAKNQFRKAVLDWDINYRHDGLSYFGFPGIDSLLYRQHEQNSSILNSRQAFNNASANFALHNTQTRTNFDYNVGLGYNYFWNATGQAAHSAKYKGLYTTKYRKFHMKYDTRFAYYQQSNIQHYYDSTKNARQFFEIAIAPYAQYSKGNIELKAGLNLQSLINADSTLKFHISPKIDFAYHPIREMLSLFAGIEGGYKANNYNTIVSINPYINNQLDIEPSEQLIAFYGGLRGKMSRRISYLFDVNYGINKNEAFYYLSETRTATDTTVNNLYNVDYDDLNILRFGGNLRYSSQNVIVELKGNYYIHDAKTLTTLSHTPEFDAALFAKVNITQKISTTLNANVIGPRQALYKIYEPTGEKHNTYNMATNIDISLGGEYQFNNKLMFFINASNLINRKQEIWYGYNSPRLVILLGARYTF